MTFSLLLLRPNHTQMTAGAPRRRPPAPRRRASSAAMAPTSLSVTALSATPPPRRPLRPAIAAAGAALLLLAAAAALWRPDYLPAAILRRPEPAAAARFYSFDLVREYPHDPEAFTQGLLYGGNDTLFESTGLYHQSSVRKVDLQTGKVLDQHRMDGNMFGEGLTLLGDSDGTSRLYQLDPISLEVKKTVTVKYQDNEVPFINELEYINGEVWANVWQTDCIARVSHEDGQVVSWIFLHELRQQLWNSGNTDIDVLNGIAWDEENQRLFVTGKLWPKLYEIKLCPVDGPPDGSVEKLCPIASFYH